MDGSPPPATYGLLAAYKDLQHKERETASQHAALLQKYQGLRKKHAESKSSYKEYLAKVQKQLEGVQNQAYQFVDLKAKNADLSRRLEEAEQCAAEARRAGSQQEALQAAKQDADQRIQAVREGRCRAEDQARQAEQARQHAEQQRGAACEALKSARQHSQQQLDRAHQQAAALQRERDAMVAQVAALRDELKAACEQLRRQAEWQRAAEARLASLELQPPQQRGSDAGGSASPAAMQPQQLPRAAVPVELAALPARHQQLEGQLQVLRQQAQQALRAATAAQEAAWQQAGAPGDGGAPGASHAAAAQQLAGVQAALGRLDQLEQQVAPLAHGGLQHQLNSLHATVDDLRGRMAVHDRLLLTDRPAPPCASELPPAAGERSLLRLQAAAPSSRAGDAGAPLGRGTATSSSADMSLPPQPAPPSQQPRQGQIALAAWQAGAAPALDAPAPGPHSLQQPLSPSGSAHLAPGARAAKRMRAEGRASATPGPAPAWAGGVPAVRTRAPNGPVSATWVAARLAELTKRLPPSAEQAELAPQRLHRALQTAKLPPAELQKGLADALAAGRPDDLPVLAAAIARLDQLQARDPEGGLQGLAAGLVGCLVGRLSSGSCQELGAATTAAAAAAHVLRATGDTGGMQSLLADLLMLAAHRRLHMTGSSSSMTLQPPELAALPLVAAAAAAWPAGCLVAGGADSAAPGAQAGGADAAAWAPAYLQPLGVALHACLHDLSMAAERAPQLAGGAAQQLWTLGDQQWGWAALLGVRQPEEALPAVLPRLLALLGALGDPAALGAAPADEAEAAGEAQRRSQLLHALRLAGARLGWRSAYDGLLPHVLRCSDQAAADLQWRGGLLRLAGGLAADAVGAASTAAVPEGAGGADVAAACAAAAHVAERLLQQPHLQQPGHGGPQGVLYEECTVAAADIVRAMLASSATAADGQLLLQRLRQSAGEAGLVMPPL